MTHPDTQEMCESQNNQTNNENQQSQSREDPVSSFSFPPT